MFDTLVREAQSKVDDALTGAMKRFVVGLLLVVAAGFATAALSIWINRQLGPELGNLIVAAMFLVAGLVAYLGFIKSPAAALSEPREEASDDGMEPAPSPRKLSDADRELLLTAVTTGGPIVLPGLIRLILRNLPLLAAIAAAIFVMTRPLQRAEPDASAAPAE